LLSGSAGSGAGSRHGVGPRVRACIHVPKTRINRAPQFRQCRAALTVSFSTLASRRGAIPANRRHRAKNAHAKGLTTPPVEECKYARHQLGGITEHSALWLRGVGNTCVRRPKSSSSRTTCLATPTATDALRRLTNPACMPFPGYRVRADHYGLCVEPFAGIWPRGLGHQDLYRVSDCGDENAGAQRLGEVDVHLTHLPVGAHGLILGHRVVHAR
jgi:hypothetical protein